MTDSPPSSSATDRHLVLFGIEVAVVVGIFLADSAGYVPLSKTPFLTALAWVSLRARCLKWGDLGLKLEPSSARLALVGVLAGVGFWLFEYFVENPLLFGLTGRYPDLSDFSGLVGNLPALLALLAANLVLAGVGEELVWRGYALTRVAELIGTAWRWPIALILVNSAFGLAHSYQGEAGVTQAATQGVLLGLLFIRSGRSLVAPIVAHTVANTCDFLLIWSGHHVGVTGRFPF